MDIAQSLRRAREVRGLSLQDVADRIHLPLKTVTAWENGQATPNNMQYEILSLLYGVAVEDLKAGLVREAEPETMRTRLLRRAKSINPEKVADAVAQGGAMVYDVFERRRTVKTANQPVRTLDYEVTTPAHEPETYNVDLTNQQNEQEDKPAREYGIPFSPALITALFLLLGFVFSAWHPAWLLFLTIPLSYSADDDWLTRLTHPVCLTLIYMLMGIYLDLWHPGWLIFLAIPIFGSRKKESKNKKKDKNKKNK